MNDKHNERPDVRDGLTWRERIILHCLHQAQKELRRDYVPTAMLYGRVVEHLDISEEEFKAILSRMMASPGGARTKSAARKDFQ